MSREIDERIAVELFGWSRWEGPTGFRCFGPPGGGHQDCPEFSTDISAAWQVVEKMIQTKRFISLHVTEDYTGWSCKFWDADDNRAVEVGETACEAICLAALAAHKAQQGGGKA